MVSNLAQVSDRCRWPITTAELPVEAALKCRVRTKLDFLTGGIRIEEDAKSP